MLIGAITALGTLGNIPAYADQIEELLVVGTHDKRTIDVSEALLISPDTAQLLKKAPGANVNGNGPLTGIPQYRGMYGPRIATALDGKQLASAGPNWMDPPLSYAASSQLQSLEIYRGIVPVSVAQESIGGAIEVHSKRADYTHSSDFQLSGQVMGSAQSINGGAHLDGVLYGANQNHRVKIAAMTEAGDDAEFPGGEITPSEYERQRYDIAYGFRTGQHSIALDYTYTDTGETGTPALAMDIEYFEGDLLSLDYGFALDSDFSVEASIYGSQLDHGMTNYHLRQAPAPDRWRQNIADSDNIGFKLQSTLKDDNGSWELGVDGFSEAHNSDIDNPNNPMFFVVNFNEAERDILGVFLERQQDWAAWSGEFGARYNYVTMDAGKVNASSAMMMPPAQILRDNFNDADRKQTDNNIDLLAKAWYSTSDSTRWYAGIAQKYRSPSYQERYLWMPLQATGGLADGYTYTGNIELDPEVSRQLEFGLDFSNDVFTISPRFFYHRVDDYIQGTPSKVAPAVMLVRMMNASNGSNNPDPLQFNNVDAELYGFDMDWAWSMNEHWSLSGIVNYVRGERRDIDDNLYRIAPPNTSVRLSYLSSNWSAGVESVLYASQDDVSETNSEKETAGYGLVNLSTTWQATSSLNLAAGVDNVFDKEYEDHLGGYNRAENPDIAKGSRLPGYGTNVFVRAVWEF
ncbi:MAG: TonB-dependent receptor [Proteobacteria bacterium]|nr:TonB-dependent receptor [Pseudomonadota bacterium]